MRDYRPLLGDGVQEIAPAPGVCMLDSTVCDIYIIDDSGSIIGRPVLTACVDAFSGMCCGYSLGWEGGVYSLRGLMLNTIADKVRWCRERGIFIEPEQMPDMTLLDFRQASPTLFPQKFLNEFWRNPIAQQLLFAVSTVATRRKMLPQRSFS